MRKVCPRPASNKMENLTKHQLILVTLLVSFVTSIATGVITFSLLREAPTSVTQTINRVVERTVEQVVPVEIITNVMREVKEVKVTIDEEAEIISAIAKNKSSFVRLYSADEKGDKSLYVTLGIVVKDDGLIVADKSFISDKAKYVAESCDGGAVPVVIVARNDAGGTSYLKAREKNTAVSKLFPVLFDPNIPKLGQTVIALGGEAKTGIIKGIITGFSEKDGRSYYEVDFPVPDSFMGAMLISSRGNLLGIRTKRSEVVGRNIFISGNSIPLELETIQFDSLSATSSSANLPLDIEKTVSVN